MLLNDSLNEDPTTWAPDTVFNADMGKNLFYESVDTRISG